MYAYYYNTYTGIIKGNYRLWTINIQTGYDAIQDPAPSTVNLRFRKRLQWQYSAPSGGSITRGVMPSYARLEFLDPARTIFNVLKASLLAGESDRKYRVIISSGVYEWYGYVQLKEISQGIHWRLKVPTVEIQVNDGLSTLAKDTGAIQEYGAVSEMTRTILSDNVHPLPILFKNRWFPDPIEAGAAVMSHVKIQFVKNLISGGFTDSETLLKKLSGHFFFRVFQDLKARWRLEQTNLIGRAMGVDEGCEYMEYQAPDVRPVDPLLEVESVGCTAASVTIEDHAYPIKADLRETFSDQFRQININYQKDSPFLGVSFQRDSLFNHWIDVNTPYFWKLGTGTIERDARGSEGAGALKMHTGSTREMYFFHFGEGEEIYFKFSAWAASEALSGVAVDGYFDVTLSFIPEEPGGPQYWLDADGLWVDVPTAINSGLMSGNANGADPLTYTNFFIRSVQPVPVNGQLYLKIEATDPGVYMVFDHVKLDPVDADGNQINDVEWDATVYNRSGGEVVTGEEYDFETGVYQYQSVGGLVGSLAQIAQGISLWRSDGADYLGVEPAGYISINGWYEKSDPATLFYDFEYMAAVMGFLQFVPHSLPILRGSVAEMIDPGTVVNLNGVRHVPLNLTIDGITEVTTGDFIQDITAPGDLGDPFAGEYIVI